jgi:hypothetical protein
VTRLQNNICYSFLNGDLDAVTTTAIPILSAFKEGGVAGTNIATVSSPDVLVVTCEEEVMYVTAYTSGATTIATVLRGQEGTIAAAHPTGARIYNTPTKLDIDPPGGAMVVAVAASNAPASFIARADYVCDGVDDQVQIQAAIDSLLGFPGQVALSPGDFFITAAITTDISQFVQVDGMRTYYETGTGTMIQRTGNANYSAFDIGSSGVLRLRGLAILDPADDVNTSALVRVGGAAGLSTDHVELINWQTGAAVDFPTSGSSSGFIEATHSYFEGSIGLQCANSAAISINVTLVNCHLYGGIDMVVGGAAKFILSDVYFQGGAPCRIDGNTGNTPMPEVKITGGRMRGNPETLYLTDCSRVEIDGVTISSGNPGTAMRLGNVDSGRISGCSIEMSSGHHGIWLLDCDRVVVEGNNLTTTALSADATYSGILLDGNTNDCLVTGNQIRTTGTNKWLYGIRIDDSTCDNNKVVDNDIRGSSKTAGNEFSDNGTGTRGWSEIELAYLPGNAVVAAGVKHVYFSQDAVLGRTFLTTNVAPTGADLIVDINKGGTTIYTTQANRPKITTASGSTNGSSTILPDVTSMPAGNDLTVDVDQIGSTLPGTELVVTQRYMPL